MITNRPAAERTIRSRIDMADHLIAANQAGERGEVDLATSDRNLLEEVDDHGAAGASPLASVEAQRISQAELAISNQKLTEEAHERDIAQASLSKSVEELRLSEANLATSNRQLLEDVRERDVAQASLSKCVAELRLSEANLATSNRQLLEEVHARDVAQASLSRSVAELKRSNAQLDSFAYAASHDLKAPLRGIRNLTEWITEDLKQTAGPDILQNLALLHNRVERLDMLLDSLLQYSRVGRGGRPPETIDIRALVGEITDYIAPPAGFTVTFEGSAPGIHVDRAPLEQVLRNLIANALKHHDKDAGTVTVSSRDLGSLVEMRVEDDGPGIRPNFHARIFEMFQTLQSRDTLEGGGMGLAIVKKLVEGHGGLIRVESAPPKRGTALVFTWEKDELSMAA